MNARISFAVAVLFIGEIFLTPWTSYAQVTNSTAPEEILFMDIPQVNVASKKAEDPMTAPGTVFVVTDKDIQRYGWRDLAEILTAAFPSFEMYSQDVKVDGSMRGFQGTFNQVIFMINGREFNEQRTNQAWIMDGSLPAGKIKRIEVMEGPNSILYGSYAMQGVINVVLKEEEDTDKTGGHVSTSYGQGGRKLYEGVYHGKTDSATYGYDFSYFSSQGNFKELADFNADPFYSRSPALDSVRYRGREDFSLAGDQFTADAYAKVGDFYTGYNMWRADGLFGLDNPQYDIQGNRALELTTMPYFGWKHQFTENLDLKTEVQRLDNHQLYDFPSGDPTVSTSVWHTASFEVFDHRTSFTSQSNWKANDRISATFGYDYTSIEAGPGRFRNFFPATRADGGVDDVSAKLVKRFYALYGQGDFSLFPDKLKLVYGYRFHKESFTPDLNLHKASVVYTPGRSTALKFTFSQGARPEGFFELGEGGATPAARSQIHDPMSMDMYEVNYTQRANLGDLQFENVLLWYDMIQKNRFTGIRLSGASNDFVFTTEGGKFRVDGIEEMLKANYKKASLYVAARDIRSDAEQTNKVGKLVMVPKVRLKSGASYELLDHYGASLWMDYFSKVRVPAPVLTGSANGYEVFIVKPATVFNLNLRAGGFKVGDDQLDFNLYAANLFNTTYYSPYPSQGGRFAIRQFPRNLTLMATLRF